MRSGEPLQDHYEALQVSPSADTETISRIFRHLAKRYHPDNPDTGDAARFDQLAKAHRVLTDPEQRAAYDVKHREHWSQRWKLLEEARAEEGFGEDRQVRLQLLSLFYVQRRRSLQKPGLGSLELARLLDCPGEIIDFHVWYLREKGWIVRMENGQFAITAPGVDQVEEHSLLLGPDHLIAADGFADGGPKRVHRIPRSSAAA